MPKILIIGGKHTNFVKLSSLLKDLGPDCRLITAESGQAGYKTAQKEMPDTILLDLTNQWVAGYEVCRRFKTDAELKSIPVVMLTDSMPDIGEGAESQELCADTLLREPIDANELVIQIKSMLRMKAAEDALRSKNTELKTKISEQTRKLQESEQRYRNVVQDQTEFIVRYLPDGICTFVNDSYCQTHNTTRERMINTSLSDGLPRSEKKQFKQTIKNLSPENPIACGEHEIKTSRGDTALHQWTDRGIFNKQGVLIEIQRVGRDITEQKRAEEKARKRTQYLELLNTLNEFVNQRKSLPEILRLFTEGFKKIFSCVGTSVTLISEDQEHSLIHHYSISPEIRDQIKKLTGSSIPEMNILSKAGFLPLEMVKDGKPCLVNDPKPIQDIIASYIENKLLQKILPGMVLILQINSIMLIPLIVKGEIIGLVDASRKDSFLEWEIKLFETVSQQVASIIEREKIERKLLKLSQIVEQSPLSILVTDTAGNVEYANSKFTELTGYSRDEVIGKKPRILKPGKQPDDDYKKLWTTIKSGGTWRGEFHNTKKNGELYWESVKITPMFDKSHKITNYLAVRDDITEMKQARSELIENEALYRDLIEKSGIAILIDDEQGNITYFNQTCLNIFGYSEQEFRGLQIATLVHPDDTAKVMKIHKDRRKGLEVASRYEFKGVRKDGDPVDLEVDIVELRENGSFVGTRSYLWDISERKQAEAALTAYAQRQDKLLSTTLKLGSTLETADILDLVCLETMSLLDSNAVTIYLLDQTGTILNPAAAYSPDEQEQIMARSLDIDNSLTGKVIKAKTGMIFNNAINQPGAFQIPGTPVNVEDNILVVPLVSEGIVMGAITLYRKGAPFVQNDLIYASTVALYASVAVNNARSHENLKREILAREASEELTHDLGRIIEDSHNEIYLFDAETLHFTFMNKGARENIGYSTEEMLQLTPLAIKPYHDLDSFKQLLEPLRTGDVEYIQYETIHRRKDKSEYPVHVTLHLTSYLGKPNYLAIISDISEQKHQQEKQNELKAQLLQSQKLEAVGTMAGGIAHDFNNILQGMFLYMGIVKDQISDDEELLANFQNIIDGADRAKELVAQILTFSRKDETDLKPNKLQYLLKNALKLIRASTPATIEVRADIASDCGAVLCDVTQMHQVFINLCNNAVHAMPEEGGVLSVSLQEIEKQTAQGTGKELSSKNKMVELIVSDTGYGMDAETLARIFDPFFTTKGVGEGTGLGLSIVHGIIMDMGGDVYVESEPGKGTTIRLLMPIAQDMTDGLSHSDKGRAELQGLRILLVDDDEAILSAGKFSLEQKGFTVVTASNGRQALQLVHEDVKAYDLIITDLTMPEMTGMQLAQEIRALSDDVFIILTSGNLDPELRREFDALGFNGFVGKPWTVDELLEVVSGFDFEGVKPSLSSSNNLFRTGSEEGKQDDG